MFILINCNLVFKFLKIEKKTADFFYKAYN